MRYLRLHLFYIMILYGFAWMTGSGYEAAALPVSEAYVFLKLLTMLIPDSTFRLAFTNGLMSESMLLWFVSMLLWNLLHKKNCLEENDGKY